MINAEEMYEISINRIPEIVNEIMDGVKEHIIQRCEQEANKGATYYTFRFKNGNEFVKEKLVSKCLELAKFFEENGYKISIDNGGNGVIISLYFTVSWNNKIKIISNRFGISKNIHVYDSESGVNYEYFRE